MKYLKTACYLVKKDQNKIKQNKLHASTAKK